MQTRDLGQTKLRDYEIDGLDDEAFFKYLQGRYEWGDLGSVYNDEIHFLSKNFYKRVNKNIEKALKEINAELNGLELLNDLRPNQRDKDFNYLFRYLVQQIQHAETQDELKAYYEFFQAAIVDHNANSLHKLSDNFMQAVGTLCDARCANLQTESEHSRGVWLSVGKMVVGAATYLPVPLDIYTVLAWGEWARSLLTTQMLHPVTPGERLKNAAKTTIDFVKDIPNKVAKIPAFVKNHWKALLFGTVLAAGLGATLGIVVVPLIAPIVVPAITLTAGLIIAGLAVSAIAAGVYKFQQYAREKRIAKRMDDCEKVIINTLKIPNKKPNPKSSNAVIKNSLRVEPDVVSEHVQTIAEKPLQQEKQVESTVTPLAPSVNNAGAIPAPVYSRAEPILYGSVEDSLTKRPKSSR